MINGIYAATLSLLNNDLGLDINKTISHAEKVIDNGCHGVVFFGSLVLDVFFPLAADADQAVPGRDGDAVADHLRQLRRRRDGLLPRDRLERAVAPRIIMLPPLRLARRRRHAPAQHGADGAARRAPRRRPRRRVDQRRRRPPLGALRLAAVL